MTNKGKYIVPIVLITIFAIIVGILVIKGDIFNKNVDYIKEKSAENLDKVKKERVKYVEVVGDIDEHIGKRIENRGKVIGKKERLGKDRYTIKIGVSREDDLELKRMLGDKATDDIIWTIDIETDKTKIDIYKGDRVNIVGTVKEIIHYEEQNRYTIILTDGKIDLDGKQ